MIATFIRRPVFTLMLVLLLVVFGIQSFPKLGVDLNPDVDMPMVSITANMTGASPEEMESLITKPIEDAVSSLAGIKSLSSSAREGISQTTIEFAYGTDSKLAANEVREKVAIAKKKLPDSIDDPIVQRFDISAQAIGIYSLSSTQRSVGELRKLASDRVKDELQRLDGVAEVNIYGASDREIQIQVDAQKLAQYQLTIGQVAKAISDQNLNAPGGNVIEDGLKVSVRTMGKYQSIDEIKNVAVANAGGSVVRLGDVAAVRDGWAEESVAANLDGLPGVLIAVQKQSGTNTVAVADAVKQAMAEIGATLPADIHVAIAKDGSSFIKDSVADVMSALILGGLLAVLITYLFLQDGRATLISALAIPTSLVATFFLMQLMGFTLNTMSLMALSLAVGIVIDDAIVVVENIYRHMEMGKSPFAAARDATGQLGLAIIATTLTLLAVFVPVGSMEGMVGQFFKQFGLTVSFAVVFSTFVAFTLTPMLSAYCLKQSGSAVISKRRWQRWDDFLARFESGYLKLQSAYRQALVWALKRPKKVLAAALLSLLINPILLPFLGKEFQPSYDSGEFSIQVTADPGTSLDKMKQLLKPLEAQLEELPEKDISYAIIGQKGANQATVGVKLIPAGKRDKSMDTIMDELRVAFQGYGSLKITVQSNQGMGGGDSRPVQLALRGSDLEVLTGYAEQIADGLRAAPGSSDVDLSIDKSAPEIRVLPDVLKVSASGLDAAQIAAAVQMAFIGQTTQNQYSAGGNDYDIRVRLQAENRLNITDVENLLIAAPQGTFVRLGDIAQVKSAAGATQINRENRQREIIVYANAVGVPPGDLMQTAEEIARELAMPLGYTYAFAGDAEAMQETFGEMAGALVMGCVLIYMVLAAQYGSFVHPLTIMLSLPFAVSGAIAGLLFTGQTMNMMSLIGFIMLMGLVTKNAILLVDHANQMREAGMSMHEALIDAGTVRLRPILMTTLSMIFGVLPIALGIGAGAELRQSMGIVLIGGLTTSTLLTLLVVPIIYLLFDRWQVKLAFKKLE